MEPQRPDPVAAKEKLMRIPEEGRALAAAFLKANNAERRIPEWRAGQIISFITYVENYTADVVTGYTRGRADLVAQAVRNLAELHIWTLYCSASEENAKRFYDDAMRDLRETIEVLQKLYTTVNALPNSDIGVMLATIRTDAPKFITGEVDRPYLRVAGAAEMMGRRDLHSPFYKIISKFSHPTALTLALGLNPPNQTLFDAFYHGGPLIALACLAELEKCIRIDFPDLQL